MPEEELPLKARRGTEIGRGVLVALMVLLVISFVTGLGLWIVHEQSEKALPAPALGKLFTVLHGLANPFICVLYGWLWYSHIPGGWRMQVNRRSGASLVISVGMLILTGAVIYYTKGGPFVFLAAFIFWGGIACLHRNPLEGSEEVDRGGREEFGRASFLKNYLNLFGEEAVLDHVVG